MQVLVTGCGGFLGSAIARRLIARGDQVVGLVRRPNAMLQRLGVRLHIGDIRQPADVLAASRGTDGIIHTAAIAGIWGRWQDYQQSNVIGTRHCLNACAQFSIPVLVHCSSPSVTFDGRPQSGTDEAAPYPRQWLCHYQRSKAIAEQEVLRAHQPDRLRTIALRPHLIWGPGDPHLLPRLVERARRRKLVVVGDRTNRIDTVHVENAALAHVQAFDLLHRDDRSAGENIGGRTYFITQGEPVACWDWIETLLEISDAPLPKKRISKGTAYLLGLLCEWLFKMTLRSQEPPMTRFLALQLALDHWFDISAAKSCLGYQPEVSIDVGLSELRR